jgi:predicted permease
MVSADFFTVYGIQPTVGRNFTAEDDRQGADPVTIISERLWARKFNSAADLVGKSITLDDRSYRVIGITRGTSRESTTDVFVPIGAWNVPMLKNRGSALGLHGIGRLKPGVTVDQANADLNRIMQTLAEMYPANNKGHGSKVIAFRDRVVGNVESTLLMLFAAVGLVLLIACVNVSNLMLARSTDRAREFAIRAALGAGRWRLLRQSLIESVLLALAGGAAGLLIAAWGTTSAIKALPTALPRQEEITLDLRVLLFTLGLSLLTGVIAGVAPALKTSQGRFSEALKEGSRTSSTRARVQGVFVVAEMAMAMVLLIGAGLLIRSLNALWNVDPGFNPDNVMTFSVNFPPAMRSATAEASRSYVRDLSNRLSEMPGVSAASLLAGATPMVTQNDRYFWLDGQPKPANANEMHMALFYVVEPGYLPAMEIQLKKGRFFTDQDNERATPAIVVDEMLAQQRFGNEDPIGKRIHLDDDRGPYEIVGVVGHVKQWGLDRDQNELQAQMYLPFRGVSDGQIEGIGGASVVVRADTEIRPSFFASIREVVQGQNNHNVISDAHTMNEVIADSLAQRRFAMIVLGAFAAAALLLASLGIYGVISYLVGQRTHEIGIRVALGASRRQILTLVLGHGLRMTLAGVVLGLIAAFGLTRLMRTLLYGVGATDPATFVIIAVLLMLVALLACYLPARRATKVDPLVALRNE